MSDFIILIACGHSRLYIIGLKGQAVRSNAQRCRDERRSFSRSLRNPRMQEGPYSQLERSCLAVFS